MKETAISFGEACSLAGILNEPDQPAEHRDSPAVLILNAGLLHRIGPHRLYVKIARRLSQNGVTSLRFDMSGIGDSGLRRDRLPAGKSRIRETQEAMDYLAAHKKADKFVLIGICSGADTAFRVATADSRVVGAVLIDPHPYRTFRHYLYHFAPRVLKRETWQRVLSGENARWKMLVETDRLDDDSGSGVFTPLPRREADAHFRALLERGVNLCVVQTCREDYNYRSQFEDAFPSVKRASGLALEYLKSADHTFTLLANQDLLVDKIQKWFVVSDFVSRGNGPART